MNLPDHIVEEAIGWHIRLTDDAADWDGFLDWLEADPVHAEAYNAVASADRAVDQYQAAIPANDSQPSDQSPPRRWGALAMAGAMAGALILTLGIGSRFWSGQGAMQVYEANTAVRHIALADGAHIILDRNTIVAVRRGAVNQVVLRKGGAYFVAPPDPDPSFDVTAGRFHVRDIGTKFFVGQADGRLQVQVADGEVQLAARDQSDLTLKRGQGVELAEKSGRVRLYQVSPDHVARWQTGQLVYEEVPVSVVIADIQRASGLTLTLDPRIADEHFTGALMIGDGAKLVSDFSDLTGFVGERRGKTIVLRPAR